MVNKRIFTKLLNLSKITQAALSSDVYDAHTVWLMEEDIDVIGVMVHADIVNTLGNDGMAFGYIEVSQVGKTAVEAGIIARALSNALWNSAPAFGDVKQPSPTVVMFPQGYAVPVKEEGAIYINGYVNAAELTAGNVEFAGSAVIYYVKKGS